MTEAEPLDVAVIGAGVAGAYCAYRLTRDGNRSVAVFEAEKRVGGRLWSYDWKEAGATVELGGEAFATVHASVFRLVRELGLKVEPHAPFNNLLRLYLRGALLRPEDLANPANFPGRGGDRPGDITESAERGCEEPRVRYFVGEDYFVPDPVVGDGSLTGDPMIVVTMKLLSMLSPEVREKFGRLNGRMEEALAKYGRTPMTPEQAANFMTPELFDGMVELSRAIQEADVELSDFAERHMGDRKRPARELGLWSVVVEELGEEAYKLFLDAGFENSSAQQFSLVEMTQALLLGAVMMMPQPTFWSIEGGFDRLPAALIDAARDKGAELETDCRLLGIRRDAETGLLHLRLERGDEVLTRTARRVVCTAPVAAFDADIALEGFDPDLTEKFARRRKGVAAIPAGKMFFLYPEQWWTRMADGEGAAPETGFASTDLPLRAVYYQGACGDGAKGLMTATLTDSINNDFWTGFLSPNPALFPGPPKQDGQTFAVPATMVEACQKMLTRMHETSLPAPPPDPEAALYKGWRGTGGGWSAWKTGRRISEEAAALRRPLLRDGEDHGLSCCGDSVSERHGWVEETLQSAEAMLREAFGLEPADWLSDGTRS